MELMPERLEIEPEKISQELKAFIASCSGLVMRREGGDDGRKRICN